MEPKGDIPERDEVEPERLPEGNNGATEKAAVVEEVLENGTAHVYLSHSDEDYHLEQFRTHVFVDKGLIYQHYDDRDIWIFAEDIEMIERHYDE